MCLPVMFLEIASCMLFVLSLGTLVRFNGSEVVKGRLNPKPSL